MSLVFYSPAGRGPDEPARQAAVDATGIFAHVDDPELVAIVERAAEICQVPIAAVSIVDNDRQWFVARAGLEARETARAVSFCAHALKGAEIFTVGDATADPRFAGNPLVTGELGLRFYAGAPLFAEGGEGIGALCVIDNTARTALDPVQQAALTELAGQVMARIRRLAQESALRSSRA
jgi:GAF domain-containing protein